MQTCTTLSLNSAIIWSCHRFVDRLWKLLSLPSWSSMSSVSSVMHGFVRFEEGVWTLGQQEQSGHKDDVTADGSLTSWPLPRASHYQCLDLPFSKMKYRDRVFKIWIFKYSIHILSYTCIECWRSLLFPISRSTPKFSPASSSYLFPFPGPKFKISHIFLRIHSF